MTRKYRQRTAARTPFVDCFAFFREAWSPRTAFHLARLRFGEDRNERLISAFWLMEAHIPLSGAAPSMGFRGLPHGSVSAHGSVMSPRVRRVGVH